MATGADGKEKGPMAQFEIDRIFDISLFGYDASFTNSAAMMVLAVALISAFMILSMRGRSLVPTRIQSMAEMVDRKSVV